MTGVGGIADGVRTNIGADITLRLPMAPVLVLPRVFEPDFCTQLIRLWGKGDHQDSGVLMKDMDVGQRH